MKRSSRSPESSYSKRCRREEKEERGASSDEESYVPYVPLKKRRKEKLEKLRRKKAPEQEVKTTEDEKEAKPEIGPRSKVSLLDLHSELKQQAEARKVSERGKRR